MPNVFRYAGGLCAAVLVLAWGGGEAAAAISVPDGPSLAFTTAGGLARSEFTVRVIGAESSQPLVLVRGSRLGATPKPLSGVAWSADGERIAFTGSKGNKAGIYTARANGSRLRFVKGTRGGSNPVFSPDGRRIAFSREHLGRGFFLGTTPWVADVDGDRARRLAKWRQGVEYVPSSFSHDGSALAVTRTKFGSNRPRALLLKLDKSGGRRPLAAFSASDAAFSPDGSKIAIVRYSFSRQGEFEATHKDLYVISAGDGAVLARLSDTPWIAESHPSWDPSGERIAFNSFRISRNPFDALFDDILPFGNAITQVNADGTCREKLLSLHDAATYGAKWRPGLGREAGRIDCGDEAAEPPAPDGPRLAVVKFSLSLFRFDLETVDEAGFQPIHLAGGGEWKRPLPEWFEARSWSPDGSKIAFSGVARSLEGGPRGVRLYVVGANGHDLTALRGTHGASSPVFTADGSAVAFARFRFRPKKNRRGEEKFVARGASIWLADLSGGKPRRVTPARRGLFLFPSSFSPDGETLLASRLVGRNGEDAVSIRLGSGEIDLLLHRATEPIFSPDATKVALIRWGPLRLRDGTTTSTSDLFTVDADGNGLRRLTRTRYRNELYQSWDPSGERLAFVRYPAMVDKLTDRGEIGIGSKVMQMNSDGSCPRDILDQQPSTAFYGVTWEPGPGREAGRIDC